MFFQDEKIITIKFLLIWIWISEINPEGMCEHSNDKIKIDYCKEFLF